MLEKWIHALLLGGEQRAAGLDFVDNGGTSLMLHLAPVRRRARPGEMNDACLGLPLLINDMKVVLTNAGILLKIAA